MLSRLIAPVCMAALSMVGCSKSPPPASPPKAAAADQATPTADNAKAAEAPKDHGARASIGRASVGGWDFELTLIGTLAAGKESAIEARAVTIPEGRDWKSAGVYVWVEDAAGNSLTAPSKAVVENGQLHFHAAVPAGAATAAQVVVRVREDGKDERTKVPVTPKAATDAAKAPAHSHEKTPHDGIIVAWKSGGTPSLSGFAEVKLHDDKGDVEVWLGKDRAFKEPLRLPVESRLNLTLVDLSGRKLTLAPRDLAENKDESGVAHLVGGQTDYFIFPGTTGDDATALIGKTFSSVAALSFEAAGQKATSDEFVLQPHTHAPGQEH
ncbi:MAG: hypothetical protein IV100_09915 [Myxococcales bacterium]|nr:hypothetical protein [Myxococcales bacterium]